MKHWLTKPLRELIAIEKGKKAPEILIYPTKTSLRYLQIDDLRPKASLKYCEPFTCAKASKTDAIIAWDGANAGTVSCNLEGYIGSTLAVLRPVSSDVLSATFLSRFLQGNFAYLQRTATGATIPHISKEALNALQIPLPPLAEQERIVKLLDEADELRKLRTQADRRTADLIPALFHEIFDNHGDFPTTTVADISEQRDGSIRTGPFGSDLRHSEFVEKGIPVLGIDNVVENEFRWTKARCLTPAKFEEMRRFVVFPGDVLVTIMGTVGRCVVAPADLPVCISTKHLCTVTVNRKRVEPRYLWALFLFDESVRRQTRTVGKGAIMEGWNSTIIKRLIIRIPPLLLQKEFAQRVTEIREMEADQVVSRSRLDAMFQSLLHRAFAGEI